ncbi:hypothetical protein BC831DRAFT_528089, partial [Entophlyctis helioformis]
KSVCPRHLCPASRERPRHPRHVRLIDLALLLDHVGQVLGDDRKHRRHHGRLLPVARLVAVRRHRAGFVCPEHGPNDDAVALALAPSKPSKSTSLMPGLWIPRWRFLSRFSPLFAPWSQGDVVLVAVLTVFTLVWWFAPVIARSTVDIGGHHEHSKTMLRLVFDRIAGWAGMAGMWDAGMAIVFVIRENHLMKSAVGNDAGQYHRGLKYHVGLGYASFLLISFHAVYFMIAYAIDNEFWSNMLPWLTPAGYWNALGFISWLALIAMIVSSIFKVRRSNYRIFYWTHQLYVVFLLFAFAHYFCGWYPLIGPLVYFVFDRILPRLKTKRNTSAVITRVSSTVVRIDVPITAAYAGSSAYAPGDWLNILVPSVSAVNWHPFSIASYHPASPNHFTFFVKERGLWTKGVYDLASKDGTTVPVKIDGVFGSRSTEYLAHSHLVLVGGGTGIAALIPYMQHYARVTKGRITLVWIARTADEVLPYKTLLESLADSSRLGNRVEVLFHLTRETSQPAAKPSNIAATAGAESSSTLTDKGTNKPVAPSMPASNPDATAQPKSASFGVLASVLALVVFGAGVAGYCFGRIYQPGYDMDRAWQTILRSWWEWSISSAGTTTPRPPRRFRPLLLRLPVSSALASFRSCVKATRPCGC